MFNIQGEGIEKNEEEAMRLIGLSADQVRAAASSVDQAISWSVGRSVEHSMCIQVLLRTLISDVTDYIQVRPSCSNYWG